GRPDSAEGQRGVGGNGARLFVSKRFGQQIDRRLGVGSDGSQGRGRVAAQVFILFGFERRHERRNRGLAFLNQCGGCLASGNEISPVELLHQFGKIVLVLVRGR